MKSFDLVSLVISILGSGSGSGCFVASDEGDSVAGEGSESGSTSESESTSESDSTTTDSTTTDSTTTDSTTTDSTTTDTTTTDTTTTDTGSSGCMSSADCTPEEFCDFADDQCGALNPGACTPRPAPRSCPESFEITGCDCTQYPGSCEAAIAGFDFKCNGACC